MFYPAKIFPRTVFYELLGFMYFCNTLPFSVVISKNHDIDIYLISRYIAKTVVLLSPITNKTEHFSFKSVQVRPWIDIINIGPSEMYIS